MNFKTLPAVWTMFCISKTFFNTFGRLRLQPTYKMAKKISLLFACIAFQFLLAQSVPVLNRGNEINNFRATVITNQVSIITVGARILVENKCH